MSGNWIVGDRPPMEPVRALRVLLGHAMGRPDRVTKKGGESWMATNRRRTIRTGPAGIAALAAVCALSAASRDIAAQTIRGRLVDVADSAPITGAMMSLLDGTDSVVARILTRDGTGYFELTAPGAGEYRVRAERIGYATTFSELIRAAEGDVLEVRIAAPLEAVSLEGIRAEVDRRCEVRPADGLHVAQVWDEARKALAAARWTQERGHYRYEMLGIRRQFDEDARRIQIEDRALSHRLVRNPYVARAADSLVHEGFAALSEEASLFWAPDADVLLSDAFLDTHCFRLRSGGDELVGLDFEPVGDSGIPDIQGTLWLDAVSSRLQRVDFEYVNLPVPDRLMEAEPGGSVEFRSLPNGTWFTTSWYIRTFRAGRTESITGRLIPTLEGVATTRGEVLRVHDDDRVVYESSRGRRIVGAVVDSAGVGLPGARVFVEGSGAETETDSHGRFEMDHLATGVYDVHYTHPYLDGLWHVPEPVEVAVGPDRASVAEVELEAPSLREVLREVCGRDRAPTSPLMTASGGFLWRTGILTGTVRNPEGVAVPSASVSLLSDGYEIGRLMSVRDLNAHAWDEERQRWSAKTSSSGFFRACWLPVDVPIEILVLGEDEDVDRQALETALSLGDLYPDRVQVVTIDGSEPHRMLELRLHGS